MANLLPTPVAAVLGIVPAVLEGVRRLPGRAIQIPVIAVSNALATMDLLRREYDDLAVRGERLVARVTGTVVDTASDPLATVDVLEDRIEDRIEDIAARTPFAKAYDATEDALEDVVDRVKRAGEQAAQAAGKGVQAAESAVATGAARTGEAVSTASDAVEKTVDVVADATKDAVDTAASTAADTAQAAAGTAGAAAGAAADVAQDAADTVAGAAADTAQAAADTAQAAADTVGDAAGSAADQAGDVPVDERPKGVPTPAATQPDSTRIDSAASPSVQQAVEQAAARASSASLDHDDLPLPDYDHMTLGSLRGRLRSLSVEQLVQLRTYEKAHANRLPVVTMLDNRIAKLATDASAAPSGPVSTSPAPEQIAVGGATPSGRISPASTDAPVINPPSQGVPTNPSQPR